MFYDTLLEVLKTDKRFVGENGTLLRNLVCQEAMKMDEHLIEMLLENPETKKRFFTEVNGVQVFDKREFTWVVNNRQFLPDSYTRFKNEIGLSDSNGELISSSGKVELVFPYKDCVLEGGQTKEDQKRSEIFYNETLAPDEVDRLLDPKVFTGAKRYTKEGEEEATHFDENDNLVIKGNNLLAVASLLERHRNRVKCIYIDIPYNTGNDSFGYNDKFNHSTWLCFMKTRLEVAHELLSKDGTIAISVDNYEIGYLLVLMDEIFGRKNRKNIITVRRGSVTGAKVINPGVVNIVEYVVLYSKESASWTPNRVYSARSYDTNYRNYILNYEEGYENWKFSSVADEFAKAVGVSRSRLKDYYGDQYDEALEEFVLQNPQRVCQFVTLDNNSVSYKARELKQESIQNPEKVFYMERENNKRPYYLKGGKLILFAADRLTEIDGKLTFSQPISDIWDDVLPNSLFTEGGVELKKGKKPEKLIARILELCTNKNDLVLDFFAGSGTTGAVAMKMGRRFILCEQMDYIKEKTCQRLLNTINGETGGVSVNYKWQGGGSFVYCELAKQNQTFVEEIESATDADSLKRIQERILKSGFISHKVDLGALPENATDYDALSFEDKKRFLLEILDKNLLYVNYCDIDDKDFGISDADKAFTNNFYTRTK